MTDYTPEPTASGVRVRKVDGWAFIPNPLPAALSDSLIASLVPDMMLAQAALHRLEAQLQNLPNPVILLRPMQRREVKFSSQIEDTIASVEEIALAALDDREASEDSREVERNWRALQFGVESPLPMSLRLIREMHRELMTGGRGDRHRPGEFREVMVRIGGSNISDARFVPPPPGAELTQCLDAYERFLNPQSFPRDRSEFLLELAMSHYQFETIHPFRNGNGRLGRLIISLSGLKNGATQLPLPYISRYLEANRAEYYDRLLAVSSRGDWAGWFRFFCTAVADECARNADRVKRLMVLRDQMKAQAAQVRNSTALLDLIEQLFISPAVNVHRAREALGVSQPTAQAYINALVGAGFLREFTGRSYGRVWVCDPLIAIMSEP